MAEGLHGVRGDAVEGGVHLVQAVAVFCAKVLAAGAFGDALQGGQVDLGFAVGIRVADADGVDHHTFGRRHGRGTGYGDGAAGVVAVGEQDQHFLLLVGLVEQFQAQADGVADGGVGPRHADAGVVQQQCQAGVVEGQGRLRIGSATKQDQADAVVLAPGNKVLHHVFDRAQAVDPLPAGVGEIGGLHRLRDIDGKHQVAHRLLALDGFFDPYRSGHGHHQQCPHQQVEQQLPDVVLRTCDLWCLIDSAAHGVEKRYAYRTAGFAVSGQPAVAEPRQGQQQQQPGIIKLPHGAAPPSVYRCRPTAGVVRRAGRAIAHPGRRPETPVAG